MVIALSMVYLCLAYWIGVEHMFFLPPKKRCPVSIFPESNDCHKNNVHDVPDDLLADRRTKLRFGAAVVDGKGWCKFFHHGMLMEKVALNRSPLREYEYP